MSLLKKIIDEVSEVDEVGELVALFRNSQLPTLVVEEASDVRIYSQWVEQHLLGTYKVDVLAAGGRVNLLSLYERRTEFTDLPVVFIANRGMSLFSEISEHYADVIFTQGYSIENDVYSKGGIENLVHSDKTKEHWLVKESIIRWFAFEVEEFLAGKPQEVNPSLDDIVPRGQTKLDKVFCKNRGFRYPEPETIEDIRGGYQFKLPGKLLFEMLERFSEIPLDGVYNAVLANYKSKPQKLIQEIKRKLDEQRSVSPQEILSEPKKQNQVPLILPWRDSDKILTPKTDFAVDKLVSELKNTIPPTVVVAGEDSANIIEKLIKHYKVSVRHVIGRDRLLSVYARRNEFVHRVPVTFVANQEMWLFSGIPESYADIIWTQGYSLENDLYADGDLENLLDPHESWKHQRVLNSTIKWFTFEVEEFLEGKDPKLDVKLSELVPPGQLELNKRFCQTRKFREPQTERIQQIREAYKHLLPGKFLFQILARFLNTPGRSFNFSITDRGLHDIALMTINSLSPLDSLLQRIMVKLDSMEHLIDLETKSAATQRQKTAKQNNTSNLRKTQLLKPLKPMIKPKVKVGDIIIAKILKNDDIKVAVQLMTDNNEEITFERPYYPGQVGEETKLRVISFDSTGKVNKVTPKLRQTQLPQTPKPTERPKVRVGDKIIAKILKNDGIKVAVQLMTDNNEEITFERPYYPGQVGEETKLRVIAVDSTGRVKKVTP